MPKKWTKEKVVGQHFQWRLGQRNGVWYADGRSNTPNVGKHSLGTKDRAAALVALQELDHLLAVKAGLAEPNVRDGPGSEPLSLEAGRELYRKHVSRPRVTGGAKPSTVKRYRPVFNKFLTYAHAQSVTTWNRVNTELVQGYAAWLDDQGYAYRTEYLELTTLKQAINWMTETGHLVTTAKVEITLNKPTGTDTHCWTPGEVQAIVRHCYATPGLGWLGDVVVALASTGLRISELAGLRWSDVDLANNVIRLTDESHRAPRKAGGKRRETKNSRSRSFPISNELRPVLEQLPRSADGIIFHGPRGGALKPDTVRSILVREVLTPLASEFPSVGDEPGFRDGRLHSFRHYFCSTCANGGASEAAVMHWLGHRDSQMVRHYYHLHNAEAQRQMSQVTFISPAADAVSAAD